MSKLSSLLIEKNLTQKTSVYIVFYEPEKVIIENENSKCVCVCQLMLIYLANKTNDTWALKFVYLILDKPSLSVLFFH